MFRRVIVVAVVALLTTAIAVGVASASVPHAVDGVAAKKKSNTATVPVAKAGNATMTRLTVATRKRGKGKKAPKPRVKVKNPGKLPAGVTVFTSVERAKKANRYYVYVIAATRILRNSNAAGSASAPAAQVTVVVRGGDITKQSTVENGLAKRKDKQRRNRFGAIDSANQAAVPANRAAGPKVPGVVSANAYGAPRTSSRFKNARAALQGGSSSGGGGKSDRLSAKVAVGPPRTGQGGVEERNVCVTIAGQPGSTFVVRYMFRDGTTVFLIQRIKSPSGNAVGKTNVPVMNATMDVEVSSNGQVAKGSADLNAKTGDPAC